MTGQKLVFVLSDGSSKETKNILYIVI